MAKDPAFLFYDGDAARDVSHMNRLERGCYFDFIQAQKKFGPLSLDTIQKILGKDFETCWQSLKICLTYENDMYYIEWLRDSIEKRKRYSKSRSDNRKGSNNKENQEIPSTYDKHMITHVNHMENENGIVNENGKEEKGGLGENIETVAKDVSKYFGIGEVNQAKVFKQIVSFLEYLDKNGKLKNFQHQFNFYKKLKTEANEKLHRVDNFIGTYESGFDDGKWNSENWEHQYGLFVKKSAPAEEQKPKVTLVPIKQPEKKLSPEELAKEHDTVMTGILCELYEDFLKGKDPALHFGSENLEKFLTDKGKMNGSIKGVFEKIRESGLTVEKYLNNQN